jgi:gas vesicle protein
MSKGKVALGAIIGAAAGVIAGILTAPKSGKETRADIKQKAAELKDKASARADEAKDFAEEYKERGERAVRGAIDGAKKGFNDKDSSK